MAVAASLAIHVGVVGFALGHAPSRESSAQHAVDMEWLPVSAGQTIPPPPSAPRIEATPVVAQLPVSLRRNRSNLALHPRSATPAPALVAAAPVPAMAATEALPHFDLSISSVRSDAPARFSLPASNMRVNTARAAAGSDGEDTLAANEVSVPAHLIASAPVVYPREARAAELEASVAVEIVIDTHGRVIAARALAAPGYGLEQAALRAVRAYRFAPAERRGRPVRVRMRWDVLFRLR
jgi:periplasmic protein TonB